MGLRWGVVSSLLFHTGEVFQSAEQQYAKGWQTAISGAGGAQCFVIALCDSARTARNEAGVGIGRSLRQFGMFEPSEAKVSDNFTLLCHAKLKFTSLARFAQVGQNKIQHYNVLYKSL